MGHQGIEPWTKRGLKARRSTTELMAPATRAGAVSDPSREYPSVAGGSGRWPRTTDLLVMSQALYQAELYRCARTSPWSVTSESNRATNCVSGSPLQPAGSRPYEGGGRLERQRSRAHPASNGRRPARPVHHPAEESGRLERQRRKTPGRFRGGACTLAGSLSMTSGRRRTRISGLAPPPAFQAGTTTW